MGDKEVMPIEAEIVPLEEDNQIYSLSSLIRQAINKGVLPPQASEELIRISAKLNNKGKAELRRSAVLSSLSRQFDFIKVDSLANNDELFLWHKPKADDTYRPFTTSIAQEIVSQEYANIGVDCTEREADEIRGAVKVRRLPHVAALDDRIIKLTNSYYWDRKNGTLVTSMNSLYDYEFDGVFRELFDGHANSDSSPDVSIDDIHISPTNVNAIYRYLDQHDGLFLPPTTALDPEDFLPLPTDYDSPEIYKNLAPIVSKKLANNIKRVLDVFWVWANNSSSDTMNDLLKVPVYLFLKELPKRFLIFDGDRRNGKSTFITLLETILGNNNCTEIPMKELIDPHKANDLIRSWANLPREDYDFDYNDMKQGVAFLKNVATHEPVSISNYYKQSSSRVTPRFLAAFPRNGTPDFGNVEGNAAVMIRMRAIRFENDLSEKDNSNVNFEKETFTPEFCTTYLEMILAMATYYNEHTFDFSKTSELFGEKIQAITDPATYFLDQISKWFDHVRSLDFITAQAELYFKNQGFNWNGEVMRSIKAKIMKMQDTKVDYCGVEKRYKCKKVPKNKKYPNRIKMFAEDAVYAALNKKTPEQYRQSINASLSNMTPQQAYDRKMLSVIELLEEFDEDESHAGEGSAVAAQNTMEEEWKTKDEPNQLSL